MKKFALLIFFFLCFPIFSYANTENAGFVQGIWYSSEPIFEGVPTRIYVAVRNNTSHDLTGTVRFMDNGSRIGSSEISALSGRLVEAWIDWTPTQGDHKITATVSDATLHIIGGGTEILDVAGITAEDTVAVDLDTDRDGVGNLLDTDDDRDEISDTTERERGSNPLIANPVQQTTEAEALPEKIEVAMANPEKSNPSSQGLEEYFDNGIASTLLSNATEKIESAKNSLDTYREERNTELEKKQIEAPASPAKFSNSETATITRSQIEPKKTLLSSFVTSVASLLGMVWTFILFVISKVLTHPAVLELVLLLGIIYMVYRTARRFGRRRRF